MKTKICKRIVLVVCGLLLVAAGLYGYYKLCMDPYRGTVQEFADSRGMDEVLSGEEAKEDLEYVMKHLRERHPAWLDGSDELVAEVETQYEEEINKIGEEISVSELYQAAARITAKLHDGHTYVTWRNAEEARYINDFTQIQTYGRPLTIDGVPSNEVLERYKQIASYELDFYVENQFFDKIIVNEQYLRLCGIDTSDGVVMTFDDNGTVVEHTYEFVTAEEIKGFEQNEEESEWVSYEIDTDNSVGIFTLTACNDNEEYRTKLDDFFNEVFGKDIQNVVVDLRGNGGGNSWVANEFIKYLDVEQYEAWDCAVRYGWYLLKNTDISYTNQKKEQVFAGDVYVLTDTYTYSSAMDFAMLLADNEMGIIVGEPSGNLPDSYGDCLYFQTPNSELMMSISFKRWYRIDQSKSGQPIMPDYEVPSEDALEKVYELIKDGSGAQESTVEPENTAEQESITEQPDLIEQEPADWGTAPLLSQTEWVDNRYAEDGTMLVSGDFQGFEVSGEGYEAVAESVKAWNLQQEEAFSQTMDLYEEYALDEAEDFPDFRGYSYLVSSAAMRIDSNVISLSYSVWEYSGGAHGNYGTFGVTFDAQTGQKLSFWDLAEDREEFSRKTLECCLEQVVAEYEEGLFEDYEETIRALWQEEPNWYLDATGITIIFNPYEIGPYALGDAYVTLPYQEFSELLRTEYQMGSHAGVSVLPEGVVAEISLGKVSGDKGNVRIYAEAQEDAEVDYGFQKFLLEAGDRTEVAAELASLRDIYLLQREDGRSFLLFYGDMASDDFVTYVYEITDGQIRKAYESSVCSSIIQGTVTPQGLQLGVRVDALGTYTAYGDYQMTEDGSLEPVGEWYTIDAPYEFQGLTNIRELPVVVDGQETTLPVGSKIRIIGTDTKGIMRYQLIESAEQDDSAEMEGSMEPSGTMGEGEIHYTLGEDGWTIYIDGVKETEYFENLPYAG